ncbi:MAG: hypothetical protein A2026_06870 [Deltaproteobacteria bacterium RBG_19FT_COMBO_46_12]|nr:MAG: hypothetical protein A2026_06870 [Deltaproteobacteria bacterium RBG_19FT_COMBO_46_12]
MKHCLFMLMLLIFPFYATSQPQSFIEVGTFSTEKLENKIPSNWKPLTFKKIERHTTYSLVKDGESIILKAVSETSASALTREIKIDPKQYPILRWRWKVENILEKGDVRKKQGDDYPARVYITFEYDPSQLGLIEKAKFEAVRLVYGQYPPIFAINYIWESKSPIGTIVPNPYADRVMMIVVQSGKTKLNQWIDEERNIYEDFKKAFGREPFMISGVAIMTDTDNTGERAIAYYGDILFKKNAK